MSFLLFNISPTRFVALMAPLEEFCIAQWAAAEKASSFPPAWIASLITAALNLLGSKTGGSSPFSSQNLLIAIYPPRTVFRSL